MNQLEQLLYDMYSIIPKLTNAGLIVNYARSKYSMIKGCRLDSTPATGRMISL